MESKEIEVKPEYIEAFEAVRKSGKTNMLDANAVLYYMNEMGFYETVLWLADTSREDVRANHKKYVALIDAFEVPFKVMNALTGDPYKE